jgi:ABC-type phosphate transport system substrate-binding protein
MRAQMLIFAFALTCSLSAWADLLLIVHADNPVAALERKQVVDIFMGRATAFPNQQPAHALDVSGANNVRAIFYKSLTGKNEAQVDAYWATLVFAGRMLPPEKLPNEAAVITAVKNNPAAIGYVTRQTLPAGVKVVMELPTPQ